VKRRKVGTPRALSRDGLKPAGALVKQLMNQLHSKKGQEKTLPASLWMRYKAGGRAKYALLAVADGETA